MSRSAAAKKRVPRKLVRKKEEKNDPLIDLRLFRNVLDNELILTKILNYFNPKQLMSLGRVSKKWQKISYHLANRKVNIDDFFFIYNPSTYENSDLLEFISNIKIIDCFETLKEGLIQYLRKKSETIPKICLLMGVNHSTNWDEFNTIIENNLFVKSLPKDCQIINITTHNGIIGRLKEKNLSIETMDYFGVVEAISGLLLPEFLNSCQILTFSDDAFFKKYIKNNLWKEKKVKTILVFFKETNQIYSTKKFYFQELINLSENEISLGGAVIDHIKISKNVLNLDEQNGNELKDFLDINLSGLMFCGDNVNSASIILKEKKIDDLKKKIVQFKKNLTFDVNKKDSQSIAFLFSCCGRSYHIHRKLNVESNLIMKLFPNVRLYGLFGNGELGNNSSSNPLLRDKKANKVSFKVYLHYFTSIFVIINISK